MCLSLQRSSGPCYLFGLGYDCSNHLLLHLHDVRITLHQSHACSHTAGIKSKWINGWMNKRADVWLDKCCDTYALCFRLGSMCLWSLWASSSTWRSWPMVFSSPRQLSSETLEESWISSSILWEISFNLKAALFKQKKKKEIIIMGESYWEVLKGRPVTSHLSYLNNSQWL